MAISFIHQWLYSPLLGPGLFLSFVIFFTQTVGLLGRVISPSQDRYLNTGQHKHRKIRIHTLSGIRTQDPSVWAGKNISCIRPRGHCDRRSDGYVIIITPWKYNCFTATTRYFGFRLWYFLYSVAFSPQTNYTERATAACRRIYCQLLRIEGVTWSAQRIPTAVNFLDRSRYFSIQVAPQLPSRGWVDPVPRPTTSQKIS
jgi:hypothetical protein